MGGYLTFLTRFREVAFKVLRVKLSHQLRKDPAGYTFPSIPGHPAEEGIRFPAGDTGSASGSPWPVSPSGILRAGFGKV